MFVRNGQVLGSVLHSAVPAAAEPEKSEPEKSEPEKSEPETSEPEKSEPGATTAPKAADPKADWVAYVVETTAGDATPLTKEDAESMTKADLIELYGG